MALTFYPIVVVLCLYATWTVGRITLGHWPIPSADDPKYIGSAVSAFHTLTGLLLLGIPIGFVATIALLLAGLISDLHKGRTKPWLSLLVMIWFVAAWVGSMLLVGWDPVRVMVWFFD